MFEKEAHKYQEEVIAKKDYPHSISIDWQRGAEFGYNKAKIEVEDSYQESLCNSELNLASVTEQLEDLEKENSELKEKITEYSKALNQRGQSAWFYKEKAELKDEKLIEAKNIIKALLFHLNKDTFAVIYETQKESIERAEQFLSEVGK